MLLIILILIGIALAYFVFKVTDNINIDFDVQTMLEIITVLYIIGFLCVHLIFGSCNIYNMTSIGKENFKIKYENLEKNKNNEYLIKDIIEWNKDVSFGKKYYNNFWIGPYISNLYKDLKTIEVD